MRKQIVLSILAILAICAVASPASGNPRSEAFAALYPGRTGKPSDQIQRRWQTMSNRNLVLLLRCMESLSANRPDKAVEACDDAVQIQPTFAGGYKLRGQAYLTMGAYTAALNDFSKSIKLDPSDPQSLAGRGDAYRITGAYDRAISDYTMALTLAPEEPRLWNARCWTRALAGTQQMLALADCNRAIALDGNFAQAYDSRGVVYLRLNKPARAFADFDRALRLWPNYALAMYGRGVAQTRLGKVAAGRSDMHAAIEIDPSVARTYAAHGITTRKAGGAVPGCKGKACLTIPTPRPKPLPAAGYTQSAAR